MTAKLLFELFPAIPFSARANTVQNLAQALRQYSNSETKGISHETLPRP